MEGLDVFPAHGSRARYVGQRYSEEEEQCGIPAPRRYKNMSGTWSDGGRGSRTLERMIHPSMFLRCVRFDWRNVVRCEESRILLCNEVHQSVLNSSLPVGFKMAGATHRQDRLPPHALPLAFPSLSASQPRDPCLPGTLGRAGYIGTA